MTKPDLIPLKPIEEARQNPMIWEGEEQPEGVFLDMGEATDPLALLGTPTLQLPEPPRLPLDFKPGPLLRERLEQLRSAMVTAARGETAPAPVPLQDLDQQSLQALLEMLGEGEVRGELSLDGVNYRLCESVLTGLWRVQASDNRDWLEVAPLPTVAIEAANNLSKAPIAVPKEAPGIMNGLAVLAEINDRAAAWEDMGDSNHVMNFTLLPMSPEDQQLLIDVLGRADLALESGGFGNCRVMATRVRHVWAVQFLNAMGNIILDTIEIGGIPDAVLAAPQDFEDSSARLEDILGSYL